MIEIKGVIQAGDYVRAQYLHIRPRPLYKALGALVLALIVWAAWIALTGDDFGLIDAMFLVIIAALALNFTVYLPWKARRVYRQQKAFHRELSFKFGDAGVQVSSENGQALTPWDDYLKWKQNDRLILLYLSDCMYHLLPKRMFATPAELEQLEEMLHSRIGKHGT